MYSFIGSKDHFIINTIKDFIVESVCKFKYAFQRNCVFKVLSTMDVLVNLANKYQWKFTLNELYQSEKYFEHLDEINENNLELYLDVIPIEKIFEHEVTSSDNNELEIVQNSIEKNGFLHPIVVTENKDFYILADGTHRKKALEQLNCKFVPALILKESFRRDAWVRVFNERIPSYKNVYKKLSPNQRKNITHLEYDIIDFETLLTYQYKPDLIALVKDGYNVHVFLNKEYNNRLDHLKLIKIFDDTFSEAKKTYMMISKANENEFNYNEYLLLPSPIDTLKDLEYLVKYPELRRTRASRAIIPIRLIYLPIEVAVLQKSYDEIIDHFLAIISTNIENDMFRSIYLKLSVVKNVDISWFYHILLLGDKERFIKDLDPKDTKIIPLLESVDEITLLTKLNAISHNT